MTDEITSAESWPVLSMAERRVLGVLVEKAKTTPDVYPMSLNSMMTGSNQKSNRDRGDAGRHAAERLRDPHPGGTRRALAAQSL